MKINKLNQTSQVGCKKVATIADKPVGSTKSIAYIIDFAHNIFLFSVPVS